jgi:DNA-binding MarR family transcriptional regulator/N-acetylglutamate synthase-like GNAT family acetyltransferase
MTLHARRAETAAALRAFSRFYTRFAGVLERGYLGTRYSLTEARVLYELAHTPQITAGSLAAGLGVDRGYLSRILAGFEHQKLVARPRSRHDRRQRPLALTGAGKHEFQRLNHRSQERFEQALRPLTLEQQARLAQALQKVQRLLGAAPAEPVYVLRPPRAGDLGWVVELHGAAYAEEYGWDQRFEGLVAQIVSDFAKSHGATRSRCWIAEREGERIGCIFLVPRSATVGQLRLLLVDPAARGKGIGARLVKECLAFARECGYRKVVLWTNSVLTAAAHIYRQAGFRLVSEEKHHSFGHDLVGQMWELGLRAQR